jgi:uncharacterized protein YndB with AHSA1/START domain
MSDPLDLDPIVHTYPLACSAERSFTTYVERIGEWWHPDYTLDAGAFSGAVIEPGMGGRVRATFTDREDDVWGEVRTWDPPRRIVHSFALAQSAESPSEVSVTFDPTDAGCVMTFVHGGWNQMSAAYRGKFTEWPLILDRFVALLAATCDGREASGHR